MDNFSSILTNDGDFTKEGSPFFDLKNWFSLLVSELNPDFVVGIARSAIRILQLSNSDTIVSGKLLSQNALPFIPDSELRGKTILLFDDSIIYGSTLSKIRDYLIQRGAVIHCASFIVDKEVFYGESKSKERRPSIHYKIPIEFKHKLPSAEVKKHHYALIQSVLRSPRDYNLDFPTIRLNIADYEAYDIPYLLHSFKKELTFKSESFNVTTPISAEAGVYRYTVLFRDIEKNIFTSNKIQYIAGSKMRFTFVPKANEIHIKYLPQFAIENGLLFDNITFFDERLKEYWTGFSAPVFDDWFYNQSLHRLVTVFGATFYSYFLLDHLKNALQIDFPVINTNISDEDILINLGEDNLLNLKRFWQAIPSLGVNLEELSAKIPIQPEIDENLFNTIEKEWINRPYLEPEKQEIAYESLSKMLMTLNIGTDSEERRNKNPDASRMEVGLTFHDIETIFSNKSIPISVETLSPSLDICVDYGQAVPKVIQRGKYWLRASYSGETKDAQNLNQLKDSLHAAYSEFLKQKGAKAFNRFDMQKLCASMKEVIRWLPMSTNFGTYGRIALIERTPDTRGQQHITEWLQSGFHPAFEEQTVNGRKVFIPKENYESAVYPVWSNEELNDFFDAFDYLSTAFQNQKSKVNSDSIKLLLSTCRNHEYTFEAVVTEAYSWIYDRKTKGFDDLLENIQKATPKNIFGELVIEKLYWSITFLNEAHKKRYLFYNQFLVTQSRLHDALVVQGSGAARFWKFKIAPLLDPSRNFEMDNFFAVLNPILALMERLTTIAIRALIDFNIFSEDKLKADLAEKGILLNKITWLKLREDISSLTRSYNVAVNDSKINKTIINRFFSRKDTAELIDLLHVCNECYLQINDAMFCSFYPYEAVEGGFCYIPKGKVQIRKDGYTERRKTAHYILTMDIIGSTGSPETQEMNDIILNYLGKQQNIYYEETGNDCYIICSNTPIALYNIARDLTIQAVRIKTNESKFKGLRKAISRGDVAVLTKDKKTVIRDIRNTTSLPQAVYLLEAFKEDNKLSKLGENEHDSIIVYESEMAKEVAAVLNFSYEDKEKISLNVKHFNGHFIFERM